MEVNVIDTYSFELLGNKNLERQQITAKVDLLIGFGGCVLLMAITKPILRWHITKKPAFI